MSIAYDFLESNCDCRTTCENARKTGGRNNRRRQSVLINDNLLMLRGKAFRLEIWGQQRWEERFVHERLLQKKKASRQI